MHPATTIANELLRIANAAGDPLTHLKLQKLVYFSHGWHLALTDGRPLIRESIEAWKYGPVVRELYREFASYGKGIIDKFYGSLCWKNGKVAFNQPALPVTAEFENGLLDRIWEVYGALTPYQLSAMSHEPGSPWDKARKADRDVIPNEDILEYFSRQRAAAPSAAS